MKPARARFGYFVGMADKVGAEERPVQGNNQPPQPEAGKPDARPETESMPATPAVVAETPVQSRLDGLRGWLAALDRRVTIRTQVGIVLLALAIGFGAAALYVANDARENSASEARVESLREALQALNLRSARTARQVRALNATVQASGAQPSSPALDSLQAQVTQLQAQVQALQGAAPGTDSTAGGGSSGTGSGTGGAESESPPAGAKGTGTK
jgi:hypothetical protein